jgi:hypothetical protein
MKALKRLPHAEIATQVTVTAITLLIDRIVDYLNTRPTNSPPGTPPEILALQRAVDEGADLLKALATESKAVATELQTAIAALKRTQYVSYSALAVAIFGALAAVAAHSR